MIKRQYLRILSGLAGMLISINSAPAQEHKPVRLSTEEEQGLTLEACLRYALKNQPAVNQSQIDETIAEYNKKLALANWYPQVNGSINYLNYFSLATGFSTFNGSLVGVQSGVFNYAIPQIGVNQTVFSTDVLFANKVADLNKNYARQNIVSAKINLVATLSKAYYDLLLSLEQISVYREDTARLRKNKEDAYFRYKGGLVDKVDYKQATIAFNNSMSQLKMASEQIAAKKSLLKQLMGYPAERNLSVMFDTARMLLETYVDTTAPLIYEKRIEFQQLLLGKKIQRETSLYYKQGYLPTVSAYYNYFDEYQHNEFSQLFKRNYPYSIFGLQLNIPIFAGFKRTDNIHKSALMEDRIDWDISNMRSSIQTQYDQAVAEYKSSIYNLAMQRDNEETAREVYEIVKLQYREGVKTYLDVIIAETDLRTSQINYLNALFQVLSSKIDVEWAMGEIPTEI